MAATLSQLQAEYKAISGNNYIISEAFRRLHKSTLVKMIRYKNAARNFVWVKSELLEDGQLMDKYKPEGFDMLYKAENLIYE